ncbi:MAG: response regulator [Treponema sp.]|nr:response regulator [Treponema sp.]
MYSKRKRIIIVDDNIINLTMCKSILANQYDIWTMSSGEKLFEILEKIIPDLILLDIEMPDMNGYEVMKKLKAMQKIADIPVIFLTIRNDTNSELEGLRLGAVDYIIKPFSPALLLKRIEIHILMEEQKNELKRYNNDLLQVIEKKSKAILDMQSFALSAVINLVEFRDVQNSGHLERTSHYIKILLDAMFEQKVYYEIITTWDIETVLQSAMLHDIGKISIKDNILLKRNKLNESEFREMKKHTVQGVQIIEKIEQSSSESEFLAHAKLFAGYHHEKWNGTGYPNGLKGDEIPLEGRLMAIADVYDALISRRIYKEPQEHQEVVEVIKSGRGTQFDPFLTDIFLSVADKFEEPYKKRTNAQNASSY